MVSVAMTAYNSEPWIARAMDSVLLQQAEFAIELLVADDCSQDGTAAVVRGYCERHPDRIRLLERPVNLGMQRNFYDLFEQCRGRYVAWLDADDAWTDPKKLALQVQALEADASLAVCGHFVRIVTDAGKVLTPRYPRRRAGRYGLGAMIRANFVPSVSMMFRNGLHRELPPWYFELSGVSDWPLLLTAGRTGDYLLLDRVMADYYHSPSSAYSANGFVRQHEKDMEVRERAAGTLGAEWQRDVRAGIGRQYEDLSYGYRLQGDWKRSQQAALRAFGEPALRDNLRSKTATLAKAWLSGIRGALRSR